MRDDEIETLIAFLRHVQEDQYLSLKGLAHRLGFSAGHLSMIYSGKRRPGIRFMRAVFDHFPEIRSHLSPLSPPGEKAD
ncbi:MAG: helix-turn-helix transcriptional regulator [Chloroflexota bacterium]|nr:helix-turn-helix transcriptional regulator [Chloroflexota bacterium]